MPERIQRAERAEHGLWFACSEPERPTDALVIWHYLPDDGAPCRGCQIKAEMIARTHPDALGIEWLIERVGCVR